MADVVTRFKIETTQFDSKLRDTAKALQGIARQASLGGKDFNGFGQKSIEAARALGTVASGATNTKDKLKDLVGSFNDAAKAYNSLTDEAKKGEFGQALSASLQKLQRDIKETKEDLYGLGDASKVKGGGGGLFGEGGMTGALQVFGGNMLTKGVEMLTSELADAWSQSIELANAGEGVRIAFERLNQPGLLEKLKEATHGTVSEVELMKQAIQFENFKLPLEDLATYLAFAQQKAKDTGQSIDYLVNSIVTGLGRQSKQILDNLGISASELTKRMNEGADMTKAVADIIREEMAKAGDYVETAADRAARATADAQNQMEEFGRSAAPLAEAFTSMWNDIKNGALDVANTLLGPLANSILGIQNILNTTLDDRRIAMFEAFEKLSQQQQSQSGYKGMGSLQSVTAPGGYVEVTDKNTGAVIGGKHFDNLNDKNAIKDWQKTLTKTNSGNKSTKTVKTEEQLNNEEIQKLTQEYIKASDDRRKAIEGEIKTLQDRNAEIKRLMEAAQGKAAPDGSLKALSEELSKLQQERQLLSDPIDIELHDQAIKDVQDEIDRLNGKKVEVELVVDNRTPFEKLRDSLKIEIAEENIQVDATTLQTLMKTAIQNGIDGLDPQFASLQDKMREGMNIPDSTWKDLQAQINEKLKEIGIEPIKIDFKTGNLAKDGKETEKSWQAAAQAVQTVGSAMSSIEDPAAKISGTVAQAIATIALGYANAMKTAGELGPVAWIAFAATGLATMLSTISSIHSATGYSEGGMIKGNSYSGDLIPANGGMIGLNAGEVVLNRAQQNTLASELQGSGGSSDRYMPSFVSGEQIWIALNAYTKRTGRGEVVTWR